MGRNSRSLGQQRTQKKTAGLFEAASAMAAIIAGVDVLPWKMMGERLGNAYQLADDLHDAVSDEASAGKPVAQDRKRDVVNAHNHLGMEQSVFLFTESARQATKAIPPCPGKEALAAFIAEVTMRLLPSSLKGIGMESPPVATENKLLFSTALPDQ